MLNEPQPEVCNLDTRGARLRGAIGVTFLAVTAAALAVILLGDIPRGWRLLIALPAYGAAVGLLQARAKT
jgi:hypothetical protein